MHGGWSDETVYLGSPETGDGMFKNVLDHAIAAGEINPLIVVSPTYNKQEINRIILKILVEILTM